MAEKRSHSLQLGANKDRARVESVVAYPQSRALTQMMLNCSAPEREFVLAPAVSVGGFSPGRTLGPVVATVGVGLGDVTAVGELGAGEFRAVVLTPTLDSGADDVLPPAPPLVHPTAPSRIRARGAICLAFTGEIFP